jgi:hypothetical protein
MNVQWYSRTHVGKYLANHTGRQGEKKVRELMVGWLLAEHLYSNGNVEAMIGFPLAEKTQFTEPRRGHEIEQLMNCSGLTVDADFDICVTLAEEVQKMKPAKVEITRLVAGTGHEPAVRQQPIRISSLR